MRGIEEILERLEEENSFIYVDRIVEGEEDYFFYLSDQVGNIFDLPPMCFEKKTGTERFNLDLEYNVSGVELPVPEKFRTYKTIAFDRLSEELGRGDLEDITRYQLRVAVNALFLQYAWHVDLSQLYSICSSFVHFIALFCTEDERNSIFALENNAMVMDYLQVPPEEQLKLAEDYRYIPPFMRPFLEVADDILDMALEYQKNGALDREELEQRKEAYEAQLAQVKEGLEQLQDPIADLPYLREKTAWLEQQVETELQFCRNQSSQTSQRMQQAEEDEKRSQEEGQGDPPPLHKDLSFLEQKMTFGEEK